MLPRRTAGNTQELVEGEHAWFAAHPAFLAFVELGWAGVVDAGWGGGVGVGFSAAFVDAFLGGGHCVCLSVVGEDVGFVGRERVVVGRWEGRG